MEENIELNKIEESKDPTQLEQEIQQKEVEKDPVTPKSAGTPTGNIIQFRKGTKAAYSSSSNIDPNTISVVSNADGTSTGTFSEIYLGDDMIGCGHNFVNYTNSSNPGRVGLVPAPGSGDAGKFLSVNGWSSLPSGDGISKEITITGTSNVVAGWRKLCMMKRGSYLVFMDGVYTHGIPAMVIFSITIRGDYASLKQISGYPSSGSVKTPKVRIVNKSDSGTDYYVNWELDYYHNAVTSATGNFTFYICGTGYGAPNQINTDITQLIDPQNPDADPASGVRYYELTFRQMYDQPSIITNLGTTGDSATKYMNGGNIEPGVKGILGIANGGTGETTASGIIQNLIQGALVDATIGDVTDSTELITTYQSGYSSSHKDLYRRNATKLWNYISSKLGSVFGLTSSTDSSNNPITLASTAAAGTSTTQIATTEFVQNAISGISDDSVDQVGIISSTDRYPLILKNKHDTIDGNGSVNFSKLGSSLPTLSASPNGKIYAAGVTIVNASTGAEYSLTNNEYVKANGGGYGGNFKGGVVHNKEDGKSGLVPAPMWKETEFYLKGDGTWHDVLSDVSSMIPTLDHKVTMVATATETTKYPLLFKYGSGYTTNETHYVKFSKVAGDNGSILSATPAGDLYAGSLNIKGNDSTPTNEIVLESYDASSGSTPKLRFQRGTNADANIDWTISNDSDLMFKSETTTTKSVLTLRDRDDNHNAQFGSGISVIVTGDAATPTNELVLKNYQNGNQTPAIRFQRKDAHDAYIDWLIRNSSTGTLTISSEIKENNVETVTNVIELANYGSSKYAMFGSGISVIVTGDAATPTNELILKNTESTNATPKIRFQRGSTTDSSLDWTIQANSSGSLVISSISSSTTTARLTMSSSQNTFANKVTVSSGDITASSGNIVCTASGKYFKGLFAKSATLSSAYILDSVNQPIYNGTIDNRTEDTKPVTAKNVVDYVSAYAAMEWGTWS